MREDFELIWLFCTLDSCGGDTIGILVVGVPLNPDPEYRPFEQLEWHHPTAVQRCSPLGTSQDTFVGICHHIHSNHR